MAALTQVAPWTASGCHPCEARQWAFQPCLQRNFHAASGMVTRIMHCHNAGCWAARTHSSWDFAAHQAQKQLASSPQLYAGTASPALHATDLLPPPLMPRQLRQHSVRPDRQSPGPAASLQALCAPRCLYRKPTTVKEASEQTRTSRNLPSSKADRVRESSQASTSTKIASPICASLKRTRD